MKKSGSVSFQVQTKKVPYYRVMNIARNLSQQAVCSIWSRYKLLVWPSSQLHAYRDCTHKLRICTMWTIIWPHSYTCSVSSNMYKRSMPTQTHTSYPLTLIGLQQTGIAVGLTTAFYVSFWQTYCTCALTWKPFSLKEIFRNVYGSHKVKMPSSSAQ